MEKICKKNTKKWFECNIYKYQFSVECVHEDLIICQNLHFNNMVEFCVLSAGNHAGLRIGFISSFFLALDGMSEHALISAINILERQMFSLCFALYGYNLVGRFSSHYL